jgi:hypothetical protein
MAWRTSRGVVLGAVLVSMLAWSGVAASAARTGAGRTGLPGVDVFVGYADRTHGQVANFPTPWDGPRDVIFDGCAPVDRCRYDGGAVLVINRQSIPVTINSVSVTVASCTITGWDPVTLEPGQKLIVAQQKSGTGNGCTGPTPSLLDTSDIGPDGEKYSGVCTRDNVIPIVQVEMDGLLRTYYDTSQILNTGGYDSGECPSGTNESHDFTQLADNYIALGDSYSSGEGAGSYVRGTNVRLGPAEDLCHLSTRAYPEIVGKKLHYKSFPPGRFGFYACSGAVVADVWGTTGPNTGALGGQGQWNGDPQMRHVDHRTRLVTLTIGGNDIGFSSLGSGCLVEAYKGVINGYIASLNAELSALTIPPSYWITPLATTSCVGPTSNFTKMLALLKSGGPEVIVREGRWVSDPRPCDPGSESCTPGTYPAPGGGRKLVISAPSLTQLYLQIAKQAAPQASIIVLGYPPLLPPAGITGAYCGIPLSVPRIQASIDADVSYGAAHASGEATLDTQHPTTLPMPSAAVSDLVNGEAQLNKVIQQSVATAALTDPLIRFVDPSPYFNNRWFCNGSAGTTSFGFHLVGRVHTLLGKLELINTHVSFGLPVQGTLNSYFTGLTLPALKLDASVTNAGVVSLTLNGMDMLALFNSAVPGAISPFQKLALIGQETFHPTAAGQAADACAVLGTPLATCSP